MMQIQWTSKALSDLVRLHDFLAQVNKEAAARVVQSLAAAPDRLKDQPHIGERLEQYDPREVRHELRYEVLSSRVVVLRLWHTREDR